MEPDEPLPVGDKSYLTLLRGIVLPSAPQPPTNPTLSLSQQHPNNPTVNVPVTAPITISAVPTTPLPTIAHTVSILTC
jgi:hypothetical protein